MNKTIRVEYRCVMHLDVPESWDDEAVNDYVENLDSLTIVREADMEESDWEYWD